MKGAWYSHGLAEELDLISVDITCAMQVLLLWPCVTGLYIRCGLDQIRHNFL